MELRTILLVCACAAVYVKASSPIEKVTNWDNKYQGTFCLTPGEPLSDWKIELTFTHQVNNLEIWDATYDATKQGSDSNIVTVLPKSWNVNWPADETKCMTFTAHLDTYADASSVTGSADFAGDVAPGQTTTTAAPTTAAPTTSAPTTAAPTTAAPTTAAPTTAAPTTNAPLTSLSPDGKHNGILNLYKIRYEGEGTYYGETTGGTCSYKTRVPPAGSHSAIDYQVALNKPQFFNSLACGMCFTVEGYGHGLGNSPINGTFLVFVADLCPECIEGDVDLAVSGDGRWEVTITAVQCPVGDSKIQYSFQGSNLWYAKLMIRNARIPIVKVELGYNGTWAENNIQWGIPEHKPDNHWVLSAKFHDGSIPIKMWAANGEYLEDEIPGITSDNDAVLDGNFGVQVALDDSLPSFAL